MLDTRTAVAHVPTASPERYAKQLVSHLGRRCEVRHEADGSRLVLAAGECLVRPGADVLELHATAPDAESLTRVTDVVGRHLERFGQRNEMHVVWTANGPDH